MNSNSKITYIGEIMFKCYYPWQNISWRIKIRVIRIATRYPRLLLKTKSILIWSTTSSKFIEQFIKILIWNFSAAPCTPLHRCSSISWCKWRPSLLCSRYTTPEKSRLVTMSSAASSRKANRIWSRAKVSGGRSLKGTITIFKLFSELFHLKVNTFSDLTMVKHIFDVKISRVL